MLSPMLFGFFGMPGHIELLIIAGLALLLFGHRLPSVMRSLGRGVVEFKKGVQGIEDELDSASDDSSRSKSSNKSEREDARA
jgi:sec-independent protein translocase protein TatA